MMTELRVSEKAFRLTSALDHIARHGGPIIVTFDGEPKVAMISYEHYARLLAEAVIPEKDSIRVRLLVSDDECLTPEGRRRVKIVDGKRILETTL